MKSESYWLDSSERFAGGAEGPLEGRCDVAIVGGGFTGLSAALALAKKGADVVVLEAERVASAASGRNGGHCNSGLSHNAEELAKKLGEERTRLLHQAYNRAVDYVEELAREEAIDCGFRRSGKILLAAKPAHFESLSRLQDFFARGFDETTRLLSAAALQSEIKSDRFHGGLLYERSAMLHVGRFGAGLARAAAAKGARVFEHAPVTGLSKLPEGGFSLETGRGTLRAEQVFVATGAYLSGPFPFFRRRIVPVGSFVIATEPLGADRLDQVLPTRRTLVTTKHIGNYFRATQDERLIFGGRARFALSNPQSDLKSGRILLNGMAEIFPQFRGVKADYCWGGLVDMTADRLPRAGQEGGLYFAMGYSGHGVQMSTYMGRIMADVMAGDPSANPWEGMAWPAVPGHYGKAWFLPLVGTYYRILDLLR